MSGQFEFDGINKSFFGVNVLTDISLTVQPYRVLGLIGQNGAGKSTLMNVVGGVVRPDSGTMWLNGQPYAPTDPREAATRGVAFIHQELNLFTNLSIAENLFITGFPRRRLRPIFDRRQTHDLARAHMERVDLRLDPGTPVEQLSVGERQLVEIARAVGTEAQLIIFDEPTTSLTVRESQRLFGIIDQLRTSGRSVIYISHVLGDVAELCDDVAVLRDGHLVATGTRTEFPTRRMISLMVGKSIEQLYPQRQKWQAESGDAEEKVLEVAGLSQRGVVHDVTFSLRRREILGVFGLMGSGRTELARIIFGLDPHEEGEVLISGQRLKRRGSGKSIEKGMAFVTENRREEGLLMDLSIVDNVALASLPHHRRRRTPFIHNARLTELATTFAAALGIRSSAGPASSRALEQSVRSLSGGNQQKVVIAKWLATQPKVFILDEPTRGVDVGAKHEMYRIIADLADNGAGVLVISSELEELMGLCDRILVMSIGEIVGEFERADFAAEAILAAAFREAMDQ